jgi:hypothetical protein
MLNDFEKGTGAAMEGRRCSDEDADQAVCASRSTTELLLAAGWLSMVGCGERCRRCPPCGLHRLRHFAHQLDGEQARRPGRLR